MDAEILMRSISSFLCGVEEGEGRGGVEDYFDEIHLLGKSLGNSTF